MESGCTGENGWNAVVESWLEVLLLLRVLRRLILLLLELLLHSPSNDASTAAASSHVRGGLAVGGESLELRSGESVDGRLTLGPGVEYARLTTATHRVETLLAHRAVAAAADAKDAVEDGVRAQSGAGEGAGELRAEEEEALLSAVDERSE